MKNIVSGGVRVIYPERAWACNPVSLFCQTTEGTTVPASDFIRKDGYAYVGSNGSKQTGATVVNRFFATVIDIPAGCDRVYYQAFPNQKVSGYQEMFGVAFMTNTAFISGIWYPEPGPGNVDYNQYQDAAIPVGATRFRYTGYLDSYMEFTSWPKQGPIIFYNSASVSATEVQMVLEIEGSRAYRDTYQGAVNFDMQGLARLMFDTEDFYKMNIEGQGLDDFLYRDMTFRLYKVQDGVESQVLEDTIQCIYGALQPGETYINPTKIPYWSGYPFSVPMIFDRTYEVLKREDSGTYEVFGTEVIARKYNLKIVSTAEKITLRFNRFLEEVPSYYDLTFDHTFQGIADGTLFVEINKQCEQANVNHIYLRWINTYGGWAYGLFKVLSTASVTAESSAKIEKNWQTTDYVNNYHAGVDTAITRTVQDTISVGVSGLDQSAFDWIASIAKSFWVDLYDGQGNWKRVSIANVTLQKSVKNLQDIIFTVNLPEFQNQSL